MSFYKLFKTEKPIIGMIHLLPLTECQSHPGMKTVINHALKDLKALEIGRVNGVLIENDGDKPAKVQADPKTVSVMIKITNTIIKHAKNVLVGVEVLLNDPKTSLIIAKTTGAKFIRTDYFVDKMARKDYGEMYINPQELANYKKQIGAENILLLTDIQVKHAFLIEKGKTITKSVKQAIKFGSDGIIVTGNFTGIEPSMNHLVEAKKTAGKFPVLVGSGLSEKNAKKLLKVADGAIVGTSLKKKEKVSVKKVLSLMNLVKKENI